MADITLSVGSAAFESVIRDWDESPQSAFSVELSKRPNLYGIWRADFAQNRNDFNVEVVCFGWASKDNVGNPNPATQINLSNMEITNVKSLVMNLFSNIECRNRVIPFSSRTARFLGEVTFRENWVRLES